jgi:hypothetical protein
MLYLVGPLCDCIVGRFASAVSCSPLNLDLGLVLLLLLLPGSLVGSFFRVVLSDGCLFQMSNINIDGTVLNLTHYYLSSLR